MNMIRVFKCNSCSKIHLEIGNTQLNFPSCKHLQTYLEGLDTVDATYYAALNKSKGLSKVIIFPLNAAETAHIGFTEKEFEELKTVIRNYLSDNRKQAHKYVKFKLNKHDVTYWN
jgi:phage FluMu protein Com